MGTNQIFTEYLTWNISVMRFVPISILRKYEYLIKIINNGRQNYRTFWGQKFQVTFKYCYNLFVALKLLPDVTVNY